MYVEKLFAHTLFAYTSLYSALFWTNGVGAAFRRIECASRFPIVMWKSCWPERGLHADHVTVWRWVQRYAPAMERRLRRRLKPTSDSWRVDETYIRVMGKRVYLYRAVDYTGVTIDFLLSAKRDAVRPSASRQSAERRRCNKF